MRINNLLSIYFRIFSSQGGRGVRGTVGANGIKGEQVCEEEKH